RLEVAGRSNARSDCRSLFHARRSRCHLDAAWEHHSHLHQHHRPLQSLDPPRDWRLPAPAHTVRRCAIRACRLARGKWILFQSDHGGNGIHDFYVTPASGGNVDDLTNTPDIDEEDARFSPDGSALAFERRAKSESSSNIAIMDFAT